MSTTASSAEVPQAAEAEAKGHDPMQAEPQKEHRWLQRLVGEWTSEAEASMGPGQPPHRSVATETVRSLGGLWILAEGQGDMPGGGPAAWVLTLGYDPAKQRFVGTWVGSMMTHMWVYAGELDASERVLTLDTEGPSMAGDGTLSKYRETMEIRSDDHRVFTSSVQGDDGGWQTFMTVHYRRKQ